MILEVIIQGGVAISLKLNDSCICFVNSHFAAGQEELEKRNQDYRSVVSDFPSFSFDLFEGLSAC